MPESIKGEYYFQVALYQFNRKMDSHKYFMKAKRCTLNNHYHKMWVERACVNYFICQEKISPEECESFIDSLEYILNHENEISKWNQGVYLMVYASILISNKVYDGIAEIIEYITENTPSVGQSIRDVDWYCLNYYYFKVLGYIVYEMKNYSVALKWVDALICCSGFRKKDKKYFICKIVLLKYKIYIQQQINDEKINDSVNELKSLLYTAESVIGKENPDILATRKWLKVIK